MQPFEIFMEVFGYIGTALVIFSMLMTSVVKLRVFNICGSTISMIYAIFGNSWPIVLLNASLVIINVFQLIRMKKTKKTFHHVKTGISDATLTYFLYQNAADIALYFPGCTTEETDREVHLVFCDSEIVGVVIGRRQGDTLAIDMDYATKRFRDLSVSTYLYACLKEEGIGTLTAKDAPYFRKMGFSGDATVTKTL